MIRKQSLLDNVHIAKPCPAIWSEMEGDDRMRYCKLCRLNVFDISAMTRDEAEKLIRENTGRLCMRLHRRADGRLITKDCPVGVSAMRKRIGIMVASAAALALAAFAKSATLWTSGESPADSSFGQLYARAKDKAVQTLTGKAAPPVTVNTVPLGEVDSNVAVARGLSFATPRGRANPIHKATKAHRHKSKKSSRKH